MKVTKPELLPANPDVLEGVDDLLQLSYLNEPAILYNLQHRYSKDMIYVSMISFCFHLIVIFQYSFCSLFEVILFFF